MRYVVSYFKNVIPNWHSLWVLARKSLLCKYRQLTFLLHQHQPRINPAPSSGVLNLAVRFSLTIHPCSRATGYSGKCWINRHPLAAFDGFALPRCPVHALCGNSDVRADCAYNSFIRKSPLTPLCLSKDRKRIPKRGNVGITMRPSIDASGIAAKSLPTSV